MSARDDSSVDHARFRILIGQQPEVVPPSRRAKHLRANDATETPRRATSYVVHAVGDSFAVVPYDRRGKPIRLHALGSAIYPSVEAASLAIHSYEALEERSRSREDG